ncbi:MAG: CopG family transcriptional regulator [Pseudonocardiaceae bacterium]
MKRTQICLDDEAVALLERTSARTGASRSELIRRAVRNQYGTESPEARLAALRASAGAWRDWSGTGAEFVDVIRGDLDERLEQIGLG